MKDATGQGKGRKDRGFFCGSPLGLFFIITATIVIIEAAVMGAVIRFPEFMGPFSHVVDAALLLIILTPILHALVVRPMKGQIAQREKAEAELRAYQDNLEEIVRDHTSRLTDAIRDLEQEIAARKETEEALHKSEERFRQLFQQTEDAIILFKPGACSVIDVNPVAERLYGFSRQELVECGLACMLKPEEMDRFLTVISGVKHGEPFRIDQAIHRRKDGAEIIVSMRGKIVTIQNVDLVYCTLRDITARVRLEEEARLIQAKLIHTNKMASLGVLVASIAHEINNPNNFIMSNAQLLARVWDDSLKILDEYYRDNGDFSIGGLPFSEMKGASPQLVTGIIEGARRINEIIINLKDFARQDKSAMDASVDLNRVVSLSVSLLSSQIRKCTDHFHTLLAPQLPSIRGSSQQIEQVVINLVINSLQALPDRGRSVTVSTSHEGEFVVLRVSDEGVGISPEIAERMIEPFFTTKLDEGGTGLGLSISHSIIRDHGGKLTYESAPGKGTTFIIAFPVAEAAAAG